MFGVEHRFDELSQARWAERSAFSYPGWHPCAPEPACEGWGIEVSARISPLRLEAIRTQLPGSMRGRCVFWEVDPSTLGGDDHLADPEFEKEAWLSMVMLEVGIVRSVGNSGCGRAGGARSGSPEFFNGESCLGYVFYAPPGAVPSTRMFPTGPVGRLPMWFR